MLDREALAANASKPAETIVAGELCQGVGPVAIRREQPSPSRLDLMEC